MSARPFEIRTLANGWEVGRFVALEACPGVLHAVTTRNAVDPLLLRSGRARAADQVASSLGLEGLSFAEQVHGARVMRVDEPGQAGQCDALITDTAGLGVMVVSADCAGIIVADPDGRFVGVAHASWRGTVAGVTRALVDALVDEFDARPEALIAGIAPSAGPCCYEVGPDVREAALDSMGPQAERFLTASGERWRFDLWDANVAQLEETGLVADHVHPARICTICRGRAFCSHRREGASAGRFAALVAPLCPS